MLEEQGWTKERLREISIFNLRSLDIDSKKKTQLLEMIITLLQLRMAMMPAVY